ncbi:MAG: hypothetical protein R3C26_23810 [Calditrichia bacterium]
MNHNPAKNERSTKLLRSLKFVVFACRNNAFKIQEFTALPEFPAYYFCQKVGFPTQKLHHPNGFYNHNLPGFYIAKWVSQMAAQTILRTILSLNRVSLADIQWQNFIAQTGFLAPDYGFFVG